MTPLRLNEVISSFRVRPLFSAVETKLKEFPKIRLLYHLRADFKSYDLAVVWDDAKVRLEYFTLWEKIAVVIDTEWIR